MARHLIFGFGLAAVAAAFFLLGCGESAPASSDRAGSRPAAGRAEEADSLASHSDALRRSRASIASPVAAVPLDQYETGEVSPWLDELLHDPDPNVRIQALDAWARQPGESLDPVTYALVDPDESVRARAQELFDQELGRRWPAH